LIIGIFSNIFWQKTNYVLPSARHFIRRTVNNEIFCRAIFAAWGLIIIVTRSFRPRGQQSCTEHAFIACFL